MRIRDRQKVYDSRNWVAHKLDPKLQSSTYASVPISTAMEGTKREEGCGGAGAGEGRTGEVADGDLDGDGGRDLSPGQAGVVGRDLGRRRAGVVGQDLGQSGGVASGGSYCPQSPDPIDNEELLQSTACFDVF
jgi:hypothetical protein